MNHAITGIVVSGALALSAQALAADSSSEPRMSKRQMIVQIVDCVKKHRSQDHAVSYNDAIRECKAQIKEQGASLPPGTLLASAP
jgi:hypothetical protein